MFQSIKCTTAAAAAAGSVRRRMIAAHDATIIRFNDFNMSNSSKKRITSQIFSSSSATRSTRSSSSSSSAPTDAADAKESDRVKINTCKNGIAHIELNRPEKMNSLDMKMFHAIADAAQQIRNDTSIRAVILSGRGRAFCTGLDVKSVLMPSREDGILPGTKTDKLLERPSGYQRQQCHDRNHSKEQQQDLTVEEDSMLTKKKQDDEALFSSSITDLYANSDGALGNLAQDIAYLWRDIPVPVIAVLNGMCFGGGLQLALGADMRYATKDCKLSVMEAKWGLIPDMCATITLRELVRMDVAKELTFTGKIISGEEASKLGLVTRTAEDPLEEAMNVAQVIASRSPDSIAAAKVLYQKSWFATEKECLDLETKLQKLLLPSWNQIAASGKNFGVSLPYQERGDFD